jgi:hypothetical protein
MIPEPQGYATMFATTRRLFHKVLEWLARGQAMGRRDGTLLGAVGLAAVHEAYHLGQLAAARRRYGLGRIVG